MLVLRNFWYNVFASAKVPFASHQHLNRRGSVRWSERCPLKYYVLFENGMKYETAVTG